jgi:peroxiredoxin
MTPWSIRWLRPWLFRLWERRQRRDLAARGARPALKEGSAAPAFTLPDDSGRPRSSAEWIGRGPAIVWLTNLCAHCADQARELAQLQGNGELPLRLIAIHYPGGASPSPQEFRAATGVDFPILLDRDGTVSKAFAGDAAPDT